MSEYLYELKIPRERIAVLIGKKGETKDLIEEATKTVLDINSEEGDVRIKGEQSLKLFTAQEIVKAIGRGFNPEVALLLLKGDYVFELIPLMDHVKTKQAMLRIKGRVIGAGGKTRKILEDMTECHVSVFGKTIGIIGEPYEVGVCRRAVEMLLRGSMHNSVYQFLERKRREAKKQSYGFRLEE